MELGEALAVVLKKERKDKNLSQEELAFRCDLDRTYISLLERGLRQPTLAVIFKICNALETSTSSFIKKIEALL